ncbi:hypothetical protein LWI29_007422 [Acer saccharum]|uniref:Uncharacterized protein n=1 Tax=Acer saccharum TaxID=4024 RepID=A0AA39VH06_ACESA|nr:hypothetical protein LWI29_007422 [Acer saccharum]
MIACGVQNCAVRWSTSAAHGAKRPVERRWRCAGVDQQATSANRPGVRRWTGAGGSAVSSAQAKIGLCVGPALVTSAGSFAAGGSGVEPQDFDQRTPILNFDDEQQMQDDTIDSDQGTEILQLSDEDGGD